MFSAIMRTIMVAVSLEALMILIALIAIGSGSRNESVTTTIMSAIEPENQLKDAGKEKCQRKSVEITPGKGKGKFVVLISSFKKQF